MRTVLGEFPRPLIWVVGLALLTGIAFFARDLALG